MGPEKIQRPRKTRARVAIPIFVYGRSSSDAPFKEITRTVEVDANGCLIQLETVVAKDQPLLVTNMNTKEEMPCTVASLQNSAKGQNGVVLRFAQPSPRFWGLAFPPENWDPADRKRPASEKKGVKH